jgi:hypothetical protein
MDRMSFIPGAQAREEIFAAQGRITADRACALDFAETFILPAGAPPHVYQAALAALSAHERIEISFSLQPGEEMESGELPGVTTAELVDLDSGARTLLWEVGRRTELLGDAHAERAFRAYQRKLAAHLGTPVPGPADDEDTVLAAPPAAATTISRALAPTTLYHWSGLMFFFIDVGAPPGSSAPPALTRPLRAFDALVLAALLALVWRRAPTVLCVAQHAGRLGHMPLRFRRVTCVDAEDAWPAEDDEGGISIVV